LRFVESRLGVFSRFCTAAAVLLLFGLAGRFYAVVGLLGVLVCCSVAAAI